MLDVRPIFFVIGILLVTLAAGMGVPALTDVVTGHPNWGVFAGAAGTCLFIGVTLMLTMRTETMRLGVRQAFLLTTMSWLVIALFGALPFALADLELSYTDAVFEAMSGITTTGATVIVGLDKAAPGILIWRAILQWLGGVGIIVMAVSVLPMLRVGGMQLFRMESSEKTEKALPRVAQVVTLIGLIYLGLTIACTLAYWLAGMRGFDAVAHAMTTVATGGFSTADASVGYFNNPAVEWVAVVFMLSGSLPFVLYIQAVRGDIMPLLRDSQIRTFLGIVATAILLLAAWRIMAADEAIGPAIRLVSFNLISVMTGTGYATSDFSLWGEFAMTVFFFAMFIGGCAGSTTCGLKVFRLQVLYATTAAQVGKLLQPHGVFRPHFNRKPIPESVSESVLSFFFLYVVSFGALSVGLGALGLDFLTAVSGAASAIANVGPGLGNIIGPAGTYASLPDPAKWLLSFGMLLGRLELFTVLILLTPAFWRN
jgi:trk system potassium uptake protein TrkH